MECKNQNHKNIDTSLPRMLGRKYWRTNPHGIENWTHKQSSRIFLILVNDFNDCRPFFIVSSDINSHRTFDLSRPLSLSIWVWQDKLNVSGKLPTSQSTISHQQALFYIRLSPSGNICIPVVLHVFFAEICTYICQTQQWICPMPT